MIRHLKTLALMLIAVLAFASCNSDDKKESRPITVTVGSKLIKVGQGSNAKTCMDITVDETGQKLYLQQGEILGFTYKEGYEYKLRIKEIHVLDKDDNETSVYYQLDVILSEKKVEEQEPIGPSPEQ